MAQHLQASAKRSQHFSITYSDIVGRAFGHPVAACCDMYCGIEHLVGMSACNIVAWTSPNDYNIMQYPKLLYSWRFSRYSAPIHWLVYGHMTSNNQTVSHRMPWAGNIAKTMTSNGKQFTVTREMLTAAARDGWNLSAVFKFCFCFVLLYNKSLNDWSLGEQWILFPSNLNVSLDFVSGNIEILRKQNSLFPSGPLIKCLIQNENIQLSPLHILSHVRRISRAPSLLLRA